MQFNFINFLQELFFIKNNDDSFIGLNQITTINKKPELKKIKPLKKKKDISISDLISGNVDL